MTDRLASWGLGGGAALLFAALGTAFLLAAFLQSRAEVQRDMSAAAGNRQTLAWHASGQLSGAPTVLPNDRVPFTPELVSGR